MTSPSPQESAPATAGQTGSAQHDEAARQGELTEQAERTGVVVVGAGPAGLTVANLLRAAGVDCVLLEAESREFIERRPRAGFIEEWAVRALERHGLGHRLLARAQRQGECEFRVDGERHVFPYGELSGQSHFVYPQQLLVTDLIAAYADGGGSGRGGRGGEGEGGGAPGGDVRFRVRDVALHGPESAHPAVSYTDPETGQRHRIACDFIAGCDGAHGVTRTVAAAHSSARTARHDYGIGWLALLAEAPPSSEHVVFGINARGFAAHMARSPEVTRYYLECPPGDSPDNWPRERVWSELRARLSASGARPLTEGRLIEKRVLDLHNYVVEPMAYGRLYLAGESAHLVAPIAAKGMNLALHDALLLADALVAHYERGDGSGLAGYSAACLRRVWQYQEFSQWLSEVLHGASSGDSFRAGRASARLRRVLGSRKAGAAFAELYMGMNCDH
ncbi:FAD-dependent monooxygenase [Streptomyces pathocidini]|uniref:FAD-dependent monooxygenase n=2 Tax=Streptomyces pathocidini TaxID=1650571 RepID=A0ABW7UUZ6_9ACTN